MKRFASLSPEDRDAVFRATAAKMGTAPAIVEKDFWVCWTLDKLFKLPSVGSHLIFKGGTSLSKVYRVIERFSEDIDVSISREWLGYGGDMDPEKASSRKKSDALIERLVSDCKSKIVDILVPELSENMRETLGKQGSLWKLALDEDDKQTVLFSYPRGTDLPGPAYVPSVVKIELGARSDHWPAVSRAICPYAADFFPDLFTEASSEIRVLAAERTFWEKVTILHAEFHRPETSATPKRFSRHYYDLARMAEAGLADAALATLDLLDRVVDHKRIFFRSGWANYETAKPGHLRLVPAERRLADLRHDYGLMGEMFFGREVPFDAIVETLRNLETKLNVPAQ